MYCSHCGNQLTAGAAYCTVCGVKNIQQPAPPGAPVAPPPFKKQEFRRQDLIRRPVILTAIAILDFVAAFGMMIGAIVLLVLGPKEDNMALAGAGVFVALLAALYLFAGIGLMKLRSYGRTIQLVFSWIGLIGFPLGTIISILILVYLYKPEVKILFSGRTIHQLSDQEAAALGKFWDSSANAGVVVAVIAGVMVVFVAMTGIIAAIAVPNLLNAIQRGKQKRTMADMRAIAVALESYAVDKNEYPSAQTISELRAFLQPRYIKMLPLVDGWTNEFVYVAWDEGGAISATQYVIVSAGKDRTFEHEEISNYTGGATTNFNNDIVFANGTFFQYPEGSQQ